MIDLYLSLKKCPNGAKQTSYKSNHCFTEYSEIY